MERNVRQAIAYAVDKKSIIEGIYLNNAEEAYTPISSSSWLYESSVYGYGYDLVAGANIAGFLKVADAMLAQGCI